jgi:hypothetical protein
MKWIESSGVGSWQMMEDRASSVESPAVKRTLYMCCSTVIFVVCDSVRLLKVPVLKSVTTKRLVENVTD